jgi:hypothetical protein
MMRLISAVMAVALLVSVAPVVAGDSFQALSRLPAGLTPLDDAQLAAVEGQGRGGSDDCFFCRNDAEVEVEQEVEIEDSLLLAIDGDIEINQNSDVRVYQSNN